MWKISTLFRSKLSVLLTYLRVFSSCSSLRIVWKFLWWFIISWLCLLNAPFASASFVGLGEVGWSRSSFEGSFFMAKCPITIPRAKAATTKTAPIIHARCPFLLNFTFSSATSMVSKVRISCLGIAFKAFKHWGNISAAYPRNLAALGLLYVNPGGNSPYPFTSMVVIWRFLISPTGVGTKVVFWMDECDSCTCVQIWASCLKQIYHSEWYCVLKVCPFFRISMFRLCSSPWVRDTSQAPVDQNWMTVSTG